MVIGAQGSRVRLYERIIFVGQQLRRWQPFLINLDDAAVVVLKPQLALHSVDVVLGR